MKGQTKTWIGVGVLGVVALIILGAVHGTPNPQAAESTAPVETGAPTSKTQSKPGYKSPSSAKASPTAPLATTPTPPQEIMLDLSTSFARTHEQELSKFLKQPADFDGHYIVAKWQCGNDCFIAGVIDRNNGKVYIAPVDNYQSTNPGSSFVPYSLTSNIYKIVNDKKIESYSFDNGGFTLINVEQL